MEEKPKKYFSRPQDETWQAYRAWVQSICRALTGKVSAETHSEDWWKQQANAFWTKVAEEKAREMDTRDG